MIIEDLAFGIDLGIGSCGWAVLRQPPSSGEAGAIEGIGSWIFDVPETDKERTPTNQIRRGNRLLRRVIRRRRNRMSELRGLFRQFGLLSTDSADALKLKGLDPWELRARGLDKLLKPQELAVALGHIAKRRGFKSAAKRKAENAAPDDKKMLVAINATKEKIARYGTIGALFARDVGNSLEKRREMERRIDDTTAQRNRERQEARDLLGIEDINGDTLLRYRLWKEQGGRCLYTDQPITPDKIIAIDNSVQVDHILPWSRFGDDSYNNKTLCLASANQRKKRDTPFEWFSKDKPSDDWEKFVEIVEGSKALRGFKKRNYLLKNAKDAEERFRSRNLNDTRYACRLLAEAVKLFYPRGERQEKDGNRRVFTRPGQLTAALRTAWGLESLKKVDGKRLPDDRHHALDALVVAAVSEAEVQKLTKSFQEWEQQGLGRPLRRVPEPWDGFREQAKAAFASVFVARPERRRARGEGHAATIRQVKEREGGQFVFERKAVINLKDADLDRFKDPERNSAIIAAIREWIAAGRKADAPPQSPKGDVITKVRLLSRSSGPSGDL